MRRPARPVLSVVFTILLAAWQRQASAQSLTPGMLGPNFPALIDTNGDGRPTPGVDMTIIPTFNPLNSTITIPNPWQDCNGSGAMHNGFVLTFDPVTHLPISATRDRGDQIETITPTGYYTPTQPDAFHMTVKKMGVIVKAGDFALIDSGHGYFSGITIDGSVVATMSFTYADLNADGLADYLSLPWGQTAVLGVKSSLPCGPGNTTPQIWIPLSDKKIVLDLNGDNVPDPNFSQSPPLAPANLFIVPTLSKTGLAILAVSLLGVSLFQLRRIGLGF